MVNQERPTVALVCCYGLTLHEEIIEYLNYVARTIRVFNIKTIIVCGGKTHLKTRPDESEAQVYHEWLQQEFPNHSFILEDKSISSKENMKFATQLLQEYKLENAIIYLICDKFRSGKTKMHAKKALGRKIDHVRKFPLSKGLKEFIKQAIIAHVLEWLAYPIPWLDTKQHERRQNIIEQL